MIKLCIIIFILFILISIYFIKQQDTTANLKYETLEFFGNQKPCKSKIAISTQVRRPIDFPLWLKYHRNLGIAKFYIRLEDSPGTAEYLRTTFPNNDIFFEEGESDKSGNNYITVMDRQNAFVDKSIRMAMKEGIDWVINIDGDELLYGNLSVFDDIPNDKKTIHMNNVEAVYTGDENTCFSAKKFLKCADSAPCRAYANGKAAGRAEEGVNLAGPHFFSYKGKIGGNHNQDISDTELKVLHFDSCTFGAWAEKFKHLSNKKKDDIPFPFYNESIDNAKNGFELYKRHTMDSIKNVDDTLIVDIEPIY